MTEAPRRPLFKPRDYVVTRSGRPAIVRDLNADGSRTIEFLDAAGGEIDIMPAHLVLVTEAKVRPWLHRTPRELQTADRVRPLDERLG